MKKYLVFLGVFISMISQAQYSSIFGKITDQESGEELIYCSIRLEKDSIFFTEIITDVEGNYSVIVDPGLYNLKISYFGYEDLFIKDIKVKNGHNIKLDAIMILDSLSNYDPFADDQSRRNQSGSVLHRESVRYDTQKKSFIYGRVTDKDGDELLYANIVLYQNGRFITGATTDTSGQYSIEIPHGNYEIEFNYTGYEDITKEISILYKERKSLDIVMETGGKTIRLIHWCYKVPLIEIDNPSTGHTIISEKIRNQGTKKINELILNTPGVSISRL